MASVNDVVLDAAWAYITTNVVELVICSAEPTTYAEANVTNRLGGKLTPTFTGPANGNVSGRKLTTDAVTDGNVTATGTATHVALISGTLLLYTTSLTPTQAVTSGNTFTLTAWDMEIEDPTVV